MTVKATKFQTIHATTILTPVGFSESYSQSITPGGPPRADILYQWVNANSGTVVSGATALSLWQDISGHGHDYHPFDTNAAHMPILQSTSSFNNQPAVCITGSALGLISIWPTMLSGSAITVGAIYRRTANDGGDTTLFTAKATGGIAYQVSGTYLYNVFPDDGIQNSIYTANSGSAGGNFYSFNTNPAHTTYWNVWRINQAQMDIWLTSSLVTTFPLGATQSFTDNEFTIAGRTNPAEAWETPMLMDILELVIYQGALPDNDITSLNAYLSGSSQAFNTPTTQSFTSSFTFSADIEVQDTAISLDTGKLNFEKFVNKSGSFTASLIGAPSASAPLFWVPVMTPSGAGAIPVWR